MADHHVINRIVCICRRVLLWLLRLIIFVGFFFVFFGPIIATLRLQYFKLLVAEGKFIHSFHSLNFMYDPYNGSVPPGSVPHSRYKDRLLPMFVNTSKFIGQDVRFWCFDSFNGIRSATSGKDQMVWCKDGMRVVNDDRHFINWNFTVKHSGNKKYFTDDKSSDMNDYDCNCNVFDSRIHVFGTFEIHMIQAEDFGVYKCYISQLSDDTFDNETYEIDEEMEATLCRDEHIAFTNKLGLYKKRVSGDSMDLYKWCMDSHLYPVHPRTETLFADPGEYIDIIASYEHIGNQADVEAEYQVQGRPPIIKSNTCSLDVLFYFILNVKWGQYKFLKPVINSPDIETAQREISGGWSSAFSLTRFCFSPNLYGHHHLLFNRSYFNKTEGSWQSKTIKHYISIDIKPRTVNNLVTNSTDDVVDDDCWNPYHQSRGIWCGIIYRLVEEMAKNVENSNIIVIGLIIVFVFISTFIIYILFKIVIYVESVFFPVDNLAGIETDNHFQYHVFISVTETDLRFVNEHIKPVLEKLHVKTFIQTEDVRLGQPIHIRNGEAISQSLGFIVVACPDYVGDDHLNQVQMNMVLDRLTNKNLLIVKIDDSRVAKVYTKRYTLIDWQTGNRQQKIQEWVYSNFLQQKYTIPRKTSISIVLVVSLLGILNTSVPVPDEVCETNDTDTNILLPAAMFDCRLYDYFKQQMDPDNIYCTHLPCSCKLLPNNTLTCDLNGLLILKRVCYRYYEHVKRWF